MRLWINLYSYTLMVVTVKNNLALYSKMVHTPLPKNSVLESCPKEILKHADQEVGTKVFTGTLLVVAEN